MLKKSFVGLLALVCSSVAVADDWPNFLGPKRDGISREKIVDEWPAAGPTKIWSVPVGQGYAGPAVVAERVYAFGMLDGKDVLQCLDAKTGKVLWKESSGAPWDKDPGKYNGTRATPTVEGDFVYTLSGKSDLLCRKTADGAVAWSTNVLKHTGGKDIQWGASCSPYIAGDVIYVQGGRGGAVAAAFNKKDGTLRWKATVNSPGGYSTPVLVTADGVEQLIVFGGNTCFALDPASGKPLWKYPWETETDVNAAVPLYKDGQLFLTSGYGHGCVLLKLTASSATKVYETRTLMSQVSSPILESNVIYGNSDGKLVCLKWETGENLWKGGETIRIGNGGGFIRNGEKIIAISETGNLILVQATPAGGKKLAQFKAVTGKWVGAAPVIANGKLLVKGDQDLVCYDVSAK